MVTPLLFAFQAQLAGTNVGRPLPKAAPLNSRVSKFHGLDGDDFRLGTVMIVATLLCLCVAVQLNHCCRHPLDQQNTRLLKVLPGLEGMAKNILGKICHAISYINFRQASENMHFAILLSVASISTPCLCYYTLCYFTLSHDCTSSSRSLCLVMSK